MQERLARVPAYGKLQSMGILLGCPLTSRPTWLAILTKVPKRRPAAPLARKPHDLVELADRPPHPALLPPRPHPDLRPGSRAETPWTLCCGMGCLYKLPLECLSVDELT